jgi:hypothetical protein
MLPIPTSSGSRRKGPLFRREQILDRAVDVRPNPEQACLATEVKALIEGAPKGSPPG